MKIALVEWVDSRALGGWQEKESSFDVSACVTTGMVTGEGGDSIRITLSFDSATGNIAESITIPKCSIKRIRYLKVKDG